MPKIFIELPDRAIGSKIGSSLYTNFWYLFSHIEISSYDGNVFFTQLINNKFDILSDGRPVYLPLEIDEAGLKKLKNSLPVYIIAYERHLDYILSDLDYFHTLESHCPVSSCKVYWSDGSSDNIDLTKEVEYKKDNKNTYALVQREDGIFEFLLSSNFYEEREEKLSLHFVHGKKKNDQIPIFSEEIKKHGNIIEIRTLLQSNYYYKNFLFKGPIFDEPNSDEYTKIPGCYALQYGNLIIEYVSGEVTILKIYRVSGISKVTRRATYKLECSCVDGEWDVPYPSDKAQQLWNHLKQRNLFIRKYFDNFNTSALGRFRPEIFW